jgi:glycosyltransferase involved in cell wall biosynthesis
MNILLLCNRVPFPIKDGGSIAIYNMIIGLKQAGVRLDVFALNTVKDYLPVSEIPNELTSNSNFIAVNIDTTVKPIPAFLNLFSNESYNISRFYTQEVEQKLIEHLKNHQYDLIHIEGLFMLPYIQTIKMYSDAKIAFRAHNVESQIWSRLAKEAKGIKKWYLNLLSKRIKQFEDTAPAQVDFIIPISSDDAEYFKNQFPQKNIFISSAGVNLIKFVQSDTAPEQNSLFHLGALNWYPNIEAVKWLLGDIYQQLINKRSDFKLYIAGKHTPESYFQYNNSNIVVIGEVENASDFMNSKSIMIVPLKSGSGMRLKIIEGMSVGKAIISTSIGAEGINYTNKENIIIADTTEEFVNAIEYLLDNQQVVKSIGEAAKKLIYSEYDNNFVVKKLVEFYEKEVSK